MGLSKKKIVGQAFRIFHEEPGWHIAHIVTHREWAAGFPERGPVNQTALELIKTLPGNWV